MDAFTIFIIADVIIMAVLLIGSAYCLKLIFDLAQYNVDRITKRDKTIKRD